METSSRLGMRFMVDLLRQMLCRGKAPGSGEDMKLSRIVIKMDGCSFQETVASKMGTSRAAGPLEVEILGRETIKPARPTPPHLRTFKLSLMDQISSLTYITGFFIYNINDGDSKGRISHRLKSALSSILTKFYPLAGRIRDNFSVECNDDGVEYIEARTNGSLSEYLQNPGQKLLSEFHPFGTRGELAENGRPLLIVQVTFFKCSGVAIAACISHKLIDGISFGVFINSRAAAARDDSVPPLEYVAAASVFPQSESAVPLPLHFSPTESISSNRFVFDASKIDQLKAKVASEEVPRPTRIEALTALTWKSARAASRSNRGFAGPSVLTQTMNMRRLVEPPLADSSVGNCIGFFSAQTSEKELELPELVRLLRKSKEEYRKNGLKTLVETVGTPINIPKSITENQSESVGEGEIDHFYATSVVGFHYYQAADFGWGKPTHVVLPYYVFSNFVSFVETAGGDGGIEVLVSLRRKDMALFQVNQDLLAFATLNPPLHVP